MSAVKDAATTVLRESRLTSRSHSDRWTDAEWQVQFWREVVQTLAEAGLLRDDDRAPAMTLTEAAQVLASAVTDGDVRVWTVNGILQSPGYAREVHERAREASRDDRAAFEQVERAAHLLGVTR